MAKFTFRHSDLVRKHWFRYFPKQVSEYFNFSTRMLCVLWLRIEW